MNQQVNTDDLLAGRLSTTLAELEVVKPLGRGAGSFVFLVRRRKGKEELAMKVYKKEEGRSERVEREIAIHLQLRHPNVVRLQQRLEDSDNVYLLMEYCAQGDLEEWLSKNTPDLPLLASSLIDSLAYLHSQSIMHRDLKLANILLDAQGTLKLADFGLSVQLSSSDETRTTKCGNFRTVAPEVLLNQKYDLKADCWALGIVLQQLLHLSSAGPKTETPKFQRSKAVFTSQMDFTEKLKGIIAQLLQKDTDKRIDVFQAQALLSPTHDVNAPPKERRQKVFNSKERHYRNESTCVGRKEHGVHVRHQTCANVMQKYIGTDVSSIYNTSLNATNNTVLTNIAPKKAPTKKQHDLTQNQQDINKILSNLQKNYKLDTRHLKGVYSFKIERGSLEITNQKITMQVDQRVFCIQQDNRKYLLISQPGTSPRRIRLGGEVGKYRKYLDYMEKVVTTLNQNIAIASISTQQHVFQLMSDYLTFVAHDDTHNLQLKSSDNLASYVTTPASPPETLL